MNRCDQEKRLTPFLLGDLPEAESAAFREHLAQCAACQAASRELEPVLATLRAALAQDAAVEPRLGVFRRAKLLKVRPQSRYKIIRWASRPRHWLAAAAAIVLLTVVSIIATANLGASRRAKYGFYDETESNAELPILAGPDTSSHFLVRRMMKTRGRIAKPDVDSHVVTTLADEIAPSEPPAAEAPPPLTVGLPPEKHAATESAPKGGWDTTVSKERGRIAGKERSKTRGVHALIDREPFGESAAAEDEKEIVDKSRAPAPADQRVSISAGASKVVGGFASVPAGGGEGGGGGAGAFGPGGGAAGMRPSMPPPPAAPVVAPRPLTKSARTRSAETFDYTDQLTPSAPPPQSSAPPAAALRMEGTRNPAQSYDLWSDGTPASGRGALRHDADEEKLREKAQFQTETPLNLDSVSGVGGKVSGVKKEMTEALYSEIRQQDGAGRKIPDDGKDRLSRSEDAKKNVAEERRSLQARHEPGRALGRAEALDDESGVRSDDEKKDLKAAQAQVINGEIPKGYEGHLYAARTAARPHGARDMDGDAMSDKWKAKSELKEVRERGAVSVDGLPALSLERDGRDVAEGERFAKLMPPPADKPAQPLRPDGKPGEAAQQRSAGRQASLDVERRMKSIVIPEIAFRNANINDTVRFFQEASREFDDPSRPVDKRGVNIVLKQPTPDAPAKVAVPPPTDPFATATEPAGVSGTPVTFNARFVSLWEALKIVTEVSGNKFKVKDGVVTVLPANMPDTELETRSYTVLPTLANRLIAVAKETPAPKTTGGEGTFTGMTPAEMDGKQDWKQFFQQLGVQWPKGSSLSYNATIGKLNVVNTAENLDTFDTALEDLNVAPRPPAARPQAANFNPFVSAAENRFSTFSIGVDTASYGLTRQALRAGQLPDPETVRLEEIVNAFDYGDTAPDRATFRVYLEAAPSPFGEPGLTLLRIGVKGRRLGREEQRAAVLTFLIDTSGSMSQPDRIGRARTALRLLLDQLSPADRIQIVAFDDQARLVLPPTPADKKAAVMEAFDHLQCNGSTNLEDGMRRAYQQAAKAFRPGAENRVILVSDGVANLGADNAQDILRQIDGYRKQGITCSVFGVGKGTYNDAMLGELAAKGDGVYRFLDSDEEVRRVFVEDLAATLNTIAMDVKIQVEWTPEAVRRYRQLGYETRALTKEQFRDDTVDAGEVGSGQSVTALYQLDLAPVPSSRRAQLSLGTVRVRYRRVDNGAIEEISQPITADVLSPNIASTRSQFRLAAAAGEFAELLRGSPYTGGARFGDVARLLRPVALELSLDARVKELLGLVEAADALSR